MVLSSRLEGHLLTLTIDRPEAQNALDAELLRALGEALDRAEGDPRVRVVAVAGHPGVFCTGADLGGGVGGTAPAEAARLYFRLLRRFTLTPRIVVAVVDGVVQAGGIGLVAASDVAICSESSTFRLPEVLLGLIPACVLPFLMRRIGFQPSYALSLTGRKIDARGALELRLVDQVAADLHDAVRRLVLSVERIPEAAVSGLKQYVHQLAPLSEREEDLAVAHIAALLEDPNNLRTVRELVHHGLWQERRG